MKWDLVGGLNLLFVFKRVIIINFDFFVSSELISIKMYSHQSGWLELQYKN